MHATVGFLDADVKGPSRDLRLRRVLVRERMIPMMVADCILGSSGGRGSSMRK